MNLFNEFKILKKNLRGLDYALKISLINGLSKAKNNQLIRIV